MSCHLGGDLLDLGCGSSPYKGILTFKSYRGLEIDSPLTRGRGIADDFYKGGRLPYLDQSYDSVLCNQVLEHVFEPDEFLSEINRVLKPGGKLLLSVPFVWDEHEQPNDYARYSSFGLHALLKKAGFSILQHQKLGADVSIIFQLINAYIYKIIQPWPEAGRIFMLLTVMASINILGVVLTKILPNNSDLFLDHVVLAEKPE